MHLFIEITLFLLGSAFIAGFMGAAFRLHDVQEMPFFEQIGLQIVGGFEWVIGAICIVFALGLLSFIAEIIKAFINSRKFVKENFKKSFTDFEIGNLLLTKDGTELHQLKVAHFVKSLNVVSDKAFTRTYPAEKCETDVVITCKECWSELLEMPLYLRRKGISPILELLQTVNFELSVKRDDFGLKSFQIISYMRMPFYPFLMRDIPEIYDDKGKDREFRAVINLISKERTEAGAPSTAFPKEDPL